MRHLLIVLNGMQEVLTVKYNGILDSDEKAKTIHEAFVKLRTSLSHTAPEHLIGKDSGYNFNLLQNIVNRHFTQNDYDTINWCRDIIDIFQDPTYNN
jgi:hypothetical protein